MYDTASGIQTTAAPANASCATSALLTSAGPGLCPAEPNHYI